MRRRYNLLPVKVSSFYERKVREEMAALRGSSGPLYRAAYPTAAKIAARVAGEIPNFSDSGDGDVLQKYPDRMLFMAARDCFGHCQYCFRQDTLAGGRNDVPLAQKLEELRTALERAPEVREVILSGGDPLTLAADDLARILESLPAGIDVRVHTRALAYGPDAFTAEITALLIRHDARLVHHIVHPYELCETARETAKALRRADIRQYNQFPLLRGVNDSVAVLARLLGDLDDLRIRNLAIFLPEPVLFSEAYRVPYTRVEELCNELYSRTPSWIHGTRVVLDSMHGKLHPMHLAERGDGVTVFVKNGRRVEYPDPAHYTLPDDRILLWKK